MLASRTPDEGRGSVFLFRSGMLRSPNLDKPEEVASRTLEEMASRTLEEGNYQVFQFRSRMLRISKYSAFYAMVPDGIGAQFALAYGQKLKTPPGFAACLSKQNTKSF